MALEIAPGQEIPPNAFSRHPLRGVAHHGSTPPVAVAAREPAGQEDEGNHGFHFQAASSKEKSAKEKAPKRLFFQW